MEARVLVAYATRYGSTAETAHKVAECLERDGVHAEVQPICDVKELRPYSAVVLAAALYIGKLHKEARRFLSVWHDDLEKLPVALVVPGPVEAEQKQFQSAEQQLDRELARVPWLHPIARKVVGGRWDPAKLQFPFSWTLKKVPASDARDWNAVDAWAHELAEKLRTVTH
jgi:menaquinone-dependent protoporphyrinogen oxidase